MVKLYSNSQKEKLKRKKKNIYIYKLDYKQYGNELKFHKQKVETSIEMNEFGFNLPTIKDELIWNPELDIKRSCIELKYPNLESSNIRGTVGMFLKMM